MEITFSLAWRLEGMHLEGRRIKSPSIYMLLFCTKLGKSIRLLFAILCQWSKMLFKTHIFFLISSDSTYWGGANSTVWPHWWFPVLLQKTATEYKYRIPHSPDFEFLLIPKDIGNHSAYRKAETAHHSPEEFFKLCFPSCAPAVIRVSENRAQGEAVV